MSGGAALDLSLRDPRTLRDVVEWAGLATGLGFPEGSPVAVNSVGERRLTVSAWLTDVTEGDE